MQQSTTAAEPDFGPHDAGPLAAFGFPVAASRGRRNAEPPHPLRTAFQRDRDRIVHSRAFRRLEYKTQVFVTGANDHFRTRLTHTIEVAGVARTIARSLRLNEDLAESIALAHDLGHPPFGHCGERVLNQLLKRHGGFDHNRQALRVVDELEEKYPDFLGLNLSYEVRSGLVKHRCPGAMLDGEALSLQPLLEAQVADVADDLTYLSHDLDDGISAGLLEEADLATVMLWRLAGERERGTRGPSGTARYYSFRIRNLIDMLVEDAIAASRQRLLAANLADPQAATCLPHPVIAFSDAHAAAGEELRSFLFRHLYQHPAVDGDNQRAAQWMRELYHYCLAHPETLGSKTRRRIAKVGLEVAAADHIAGMTDRFAIEEYRTLVGPPTAAG